MTPQYARRHVKTIYIRVLGSYVPCQLVERALASYTDDDRFETSGGLGLVGQHPILEAGGEEFVYQSIAPLPCQQGTVQGRYKFDRTSCNGNKTSRRSDRMIILSAEGLTEENTMKNLNFYVKSYLEKVGFPSAALNKFTGRTLPARRAWFTGSRAGIFGTFFEFWEAKLKYRHWKFVDQPSFMGEPWAGFPKPQSPGGPKCGFQFIMETDDKENEDRGMTALNADIEKYLRLMRLEEEATYFATKLAPKKENSL